MVATEAAELTRDAARSLLRTAIEARLRERLGPQIEAVGRAAADELIENFLANSAIEDVISGRREAKRRFEEKIREALRPTAEASPTSSRRAAGDPRKRR